MARRDPALLVLGVGLGVSLRVSLVQPLAVLLALLAALVGCTSTERPDGARDIPMRVDRIGVDAHDVPVVILEEEDGGRVLPIWIGAAEARSIAVQIGERSAERPNSHDLARRLIEQLDGEVVRVVVTELKGGTYYAVLSVRSNGVVHEVDSRPSDAIAIALRTAAPIFVRENLLEASEESEESEENDAGQAI